MGWRRLGFRAARDRALGSDTAPGRGSAPEARTAPAPRAPEGAGPAAYVLFAPDDLGEPHPREAPVWDWEMPFGVRDVRPGGSGEGDRGTP